jgi:hypothetical protein
MGEAAPFAIEQGASRIRQDAGCECSGSPGEDMRLPPVPWQEFVETQGGWSAMRANASASQALGATRQLFRSACTCDGCAAAVFVRAAECPVAPSYGNAANDALGGMAVLDKQIRPWSRKRGNAFQCLKVPGRRRDAFTQPALAQQEQLFPGCQQRAENPPKPAV